jgi:DNA-binding LacI/PurR family transcriptional regulator
MRPHPCFLTRNNDARKEDCKHRPDDGRPAQLAGVSKITVSRALRDSPLVTPETREKVRALAEQHGYRLNVSARNLRMGRSYSVAVVVEMTPVRGRPMSDPYPLELLGGITQS